MTHLAAAANSGDTSIRVGFVKVDGTVSVSVTATPHGPHTIADHLAARLRTGHADVARPSVCST